MHTLCALSNYLTPVPPFALRKLRNLLTSLLFHPHAIISKPNEYMKALRKQHFVHVWGVKKSLANEVKIFNLCLLL